LDRAWVRVRVRVSARVRRVRRVREKSLIFMISK